jgi:hypothetical protein
MMHEIWISTKNYQTMTIFCVDHSLPTPINTCANTWMPHCMFQTTNLINIFGNLIVYYYSLRTHIHLHKFTKQMQAFINFISHKQTQKKLKF